MKRRTLRVIRVFRSISEPRQGFLVAGPIRIRCALGRSGLTRTKREGDGATPVGRWSVLGLMYRPDRVRRPIAPLPVTAIRPRDGWCDAPGDLRYNRPVPLPYPASHERLWREDALYDVVLDLAYNRGPIRPGRGSAIFLHQARPDLGPTEGCIAVPAPAMARLLPRIGPRTTIDVAGGAAPARPRLRPS